MTDDYRNDVLTMREYLLNALKASDQLKAVAEGAPMSLPSMQQTLEIISGQFEYAVLEMRKLCDRYAPGVGGYPRKRQSRSGDRGILRHRRTAHLRSGQQGLEGRQQCNQRKAHSRRRSIQSRACTSVRFLCGDLLSHNASPCGRRGRIPDDPRKGATDLTPKTGCLWTLHRRRKSGA